MQISPALKAFLTPFLFGLNHQLVFSGTAPVHINNKHLGGKKDAESSKEKNDDNSGDRRRIVNE
jgi:hypothetical protein